MTGCCVNLWADGPFSDDVPSANLEGYQLVEILDKQNNRVDDDADEEIAVDPDSVAGSDAPVQNQRRGCYITRVIQSKKLYSAFMMMHLASIDSNSTESCIWRVFQGPVQLD